MGCGWLFKGAPAGNVSLFVYEFTAAAQKKLYEYMQHVS